MARLATTHQEIDKIIEVHSMLVRETSKGYLLHVELNNGASIEGLLRGEEGGNNGGKGGVWYYYGSITLETENRGRVDIDYLDIKLLYNITTPDNIQKFKALGVC